MVTAASSLAVPAQRYDTLGLVSQRSAAKRQPNWVVVSLKCVIVPAHPMATMHLSLSESYGESAGDRENGRENATTRRRCATHRAFSLAAGSLGAASRGGRNKYNVRSVKNIVATMKPTINCNHEREREREGEREGGRRQPHTNSVRQTPIFAKAGRCGSSAPTQRSQRWPCCPPCPALSGFDSPTRSARKSCQQATPGMTHDASAAESGESGERGERGQRGQRGQRETQILEVAA